MRTVTRTPLSVGAMLQEMHRGAWRSSPAPLRVSVAETMAALPVLARSGSVGLIWPRLWHRKEMLGAAGVALDDMYWLCREREHGASIKIRDTFEALNAAGIDAVLIKGWSVSRRYPACMVRTSGDIDIVVPVAQERRARAILDDAARDRSGPAIDLQRDDRWQDRPHPDFRRRAETREIDGVPVRVLSAEDELRLLCLHFLRHDGRRPLWLTDISLCLESRPDGFAWERLLGGDPVEAAWVAMVLKVAERMLGADLTGAPPGVHGATVPRWFEAEVLRQWERADPIPDEVFTELAQNPRGIVETFRIRWPGPISATVTCRQPFRDHPPLPIQCFAYLARILGYAVRRFPRQVRAHRQVNRTAEPPSRRPEPVARGHRLRVPY